LGNGASELIDLCVRHSKATKFRPGPFLAQYQEYQRCAAASGLEICDWSDKTASLLSIVNPCNPTGDFLLVEEIKSLIENNCESGSTVLVDESMQIWFGPGWRSESLSSQSCWVNEMLVKSNISVFIIHSWTKIWSCPGLRVGSVIAPSKEKADSLRRQQTPWSVNGPAISFLAAVVKDDKYLEETWRVTTNWREYMVTKLLKMFPEWSIFGERWLSYIFVDTKSSTVAEKCVDICKRNGVPIRWCLHGYRLPTFIRLAVRAPEHADCLLASLTAVGGCNSTVVS